MNFKLSPTIPFLILTGFLTSCNDGPKVITAENNEEPVEFSSGIFSNETSTIPPMDTPSTGGITENLHTVRVDDILPTDKYIYLNVTEGNKKYWIATLKQDIALGGVYFYRDGLLKTNFESKEYNRMFDTIYLVSKIVPRDHGNNTGNLTADFSEEKSNTVPEPAVSSKKDIETHTAEVVPHKGSIKIAELVSNPAAYKGKTVQLTGMVVKVNPNIMNRNWLHLQDGSRDSFDLVVTTNTFVPEGKVITVKAEVALDRDFGAGYRYDLILENGIIVE